MSSRHRWTLRFVAGFAISQVLSACDPVLLTMGDAGADGAPRDAHFRDTGDATLEVTPDAEPSDAPQDRDVFDAALRDAHHDVAEDPTSDASADSDLPTDVVIPPNPLPVRPVSIVTTLGRGDVGPVSMPGLVYRSFESASIVPIGEPNGDIVFALLTSETTRPGTAISDEVYSFARLRGAVATPLSTTALTCVRDGSIACSGGFLVRDSNTHVRTTDGWFWEFSRDRARRFNSLTEVFENAPRPAGQFSGLGSLDRDAVLFVDNRFYVLNTRGISAGREFAGRDGFFDRSDRRHSMDWAHGEFPSFTRYSGYAHLFATRVSDGAQRSLGAIEGEIEGGFQYDDGPLASRTGFLALSVRSRGVSRLVRIDANGGQTVLGEFSETPQLVAIADNGDVIAQVRRSGSQAIVRFNETSQVTLIDTNTLIAQAGSVGGLWDARILRAEIDEQGNSYIYWSGRRLGYLLGSDRNGRTLFSITPNTMLSPTQTARSLFFGTDDRDCRMYRFGVRIVTLCGWPNSSRINVLAPQ